MAIVCRVVLPHLKEIGHDVRQGPHAMSRDVDGDGGGHEQGNTTAFQYAHLTVKVTVASTRGSNGRWSLATNSA